MTRESSPPDALVRFLLFLWSNRVLVLGVTAIPTLIAVVYVLVVPVQYTAKATLLPQGAVSSDLVSAAEAMIDAQFPSLNLAGLNTESRIQTAILQSDRMADEVDENLGLGERYHIKERDLRLRAWHAKLSVKSNKQGLLTVAYRDRDAAFAVQVVNDVLDLLDRFNREIRSTASRRARVFLEERLELTRQSLHAIEDSLAEFQTATKTLDLSTKGEASVGAGANLVNQRIRLEVDTQVLRQSLGESSPAVLAKQLEIQALDRQLAKIPGLNSELARLLRSRDVQEKTFSFLSTQLEKTRIEEARDTPTIDIMDPPVIPQEKTWPQRTWTVLSVGFVSGLLSLVLAKLVEAVGEARRVGSGNG